MKTRRKIMSFASGLTLLAVATFALAQERPGFGSDEDVAFAEKLWAVMAEQKLVGPDAIVSYPYKGTSAHGQVLQYLESRVSIDGQAGTVIVKRNHRGEGLTVETVINEPTAYLDAMGVMFRREAGYDTEHANWFWVKFFPDGKVATTPQGVGMAGQTKPCIACHTPAAGEDFVFSHDRFAAE